MTRKLIAALPLLLALALTGCSTAEGASPTGPASGKPSLSRDEMGVKFAQCMREHGIKMDDPQPGKGIQLKMDGSVPKETVDKAMEACRQYSPMNDQSPADSAKAEERNRKFAECMRQNGVEAFPDPQPGQKGVMISGDVGNDPDFKSAQEKCQGVLSGGN
ncbi:hypothetical protein [Nonomuraea sediminis]|uniref:hypothetical protein n=1 Tax=Nonomuraea sediminis TaxID=2835864 RepID=UPI001BDCA09F|nr:hypothetical protein [Nonomuraea sediminis]